MDNKSGRYFISTLKRIAAIQAIVAQWYEPGRQDRCRRWVWRNKIYPVYGISEKTFYMYMQVDVDSAGVARKDERQMSLF